MFTIRVRCKRFWWTIPITEELIHFVGQDKEIVLLSQLDQSGATRFCQRGASRVMMDRDRVEKFRFERFEFFFQGFDEQSVFIHCDGDDVQMMIGKDFRRDEIGGFLHEDGIAGLREESAKQVQGRGDACRHENGFRLHGGTVSPFEKVGEGETEISIALFDAILQKRGVILGESLSGGAAKHLEWEKRWVGVAQAKVYNIGWDGILDGLNGHGRFIIDVVLNDNDKMSCCVERIYDEKPCAGHRR